MGTVTIHSPKTPVTKGSNTIACASVPNVCKMPGPPAPFVPTPLPNIAKSGMKPKKYSKKVKFDGNTIAIKGATFESVGDISSKGTGGGLVSANTHGPAKFIGPGSMTVKVEGKAVHLLGEQMLNNCGASGSPPNAATLMGVLHPPGELEDTDDSLCPWCGQPLEEHDSIRTDDEDMAKKANDPPPSGSGKKVGAISVDRGPVLKVGAGAGDGKLFHLATGREIKLSPARKAMLEAKGNPLGNCAEQKLLRRMFIDPARSPFPPAGGVRSIKMGIASRIKGKPKRKEIKDKSKPVEKCGTCMDALKIMLCENAPLPHQTEDGDS